MSRPLRVVVATDAIGSLDSHAAGVAIGRGCAVGAQVAVVPLADSGAPLGGALAALLAGDLEVEPGRWRLRAGDTLAVGVSSADLPRWQPTATSAPLGQWLGGGLAARTPRRVVVDLTGETALDGGAGLLGALGAIVGGRPDGGVDLTAARDRLAGVDLIGVVAADDLGLGLLGLRGAVARRGYEAGVDPAAVLAAEAKLARWLADLGLADGPGVGAAGGAAAAVLALGGRVVRGAALCAEFAGLAATLRQADVVVTGCTSVHIGNYGGPIVRFVSELAVAAERPCLLVAAESSVGRRELRTFGIEAGYATGTGALPQALADTGARLVNSWTGFSPPRVN